MTAENSKDTVGAVLLEEQAFEQFFRQTYTSLCLYASNILESKDEAEEIVQQVFVGIWEKRNSIYYEQSIKSYLYRSVYHACLNAIKYRKVRQQYEIEKNNKEQELEYGIAEYLELEHALKKAVEKLPEQCKNVFKLSRYEQLKYHEIAHVLGVSIKAVEKQMGKALRILREQLAEFLSIVIIIFLGGK